MRGPSALKAKKSRAGIEKDRARVFGSSEHYPESSRLKPNTTTYGHCVWPEARRDMLTLYEAALEETAARTLTDVRSVDLSAPSSEKGADAWQDLPLKKFTKARGLTNLVAAHEHTGLIDLADAQLKFEAQDFANLPGPLGTSGDTSAFRLKVQFLVYQLAAAANGQPRFFVLKHYKLTKVVLQNADTKNSGTRSIYS